jgi:hypothetical protein
MCGISFGRLRTPIAWSCSGWGQAVAALLLLMLLLLLLLLPLDGKLQRHSTGSEQHRGNQTKWIVQGTCLASLVVDDSFSSPTCELTYLPLQLLLHALQHCAPLGNWGC